MSSTLHAARSSGHPTWPTAPVRDPDPERGPRPGRMRVRRLAATRRAAVVAVLTLLGAFATFWRLDVASFHTDELAYLAAAAGRGALLDRNLEHPLLAKELIALSVELFGASPLALRLPGALLGLATGLALLALGRRLAGFGAGAAAAAVWWLLPQAPGIFVGRISRYALLEPTMTCFGALALLLAWWAGEWARSLAGPGLGPVLGPAVLAGAALGLSVSAKFTGALLLPAVLAFALWPASSRWPRALALLAGAGAGFLAPYLVAGGDWPAALVTAVEFQLRHAGRGHLTLVAGAPTAHPPWWASLWWQAGYLGLAGAAALWLASAAGVVAVARSAGARLAVPLAAALAVPAVVVSLSPLQLPHYHLVWAVPQALAAGIGLAAIGQAALRRPGRAGRLAAGAGGLALVAALVPAAAGLLATVATLAPSDYEAAAALLRERLPDRPQVLVWGYPTVAAAYLPDTRVLRVPPKGAAPDAIVVDRYIAGRRPDGPMARYVARVTKGWQAHQVDRLVVWLPPVDG
jgi:Dolichyl-phosphate-mannose-protein mannosyltransferase